MSPGTTVYERLKSNSPVDMNAKLPGPKKDAQKNKFISRSMIGNPNLEEEVLRIRKKKDEEAIEIAPNKKKMSRNQSGISRDNSSTNKRPRPCLDYLPQAKM